MKRYDSFHEISTCGCQKQYDVKRLAHHGITDKTVRHSEIRCYSKLELAALNNIRYFWRNVNYRGYLAIVLSSITRQGIRLLRMACQ